MFVHAYEESVESAAEEIFCALAHCFTALHNILTRGSTKQYSRIKEELTTAISFSKQMSKAMCPWA